MSIATFGPQGEPLLIEGRSVKHHPAKHKAVMFGPQGEPLEYRYSGDQPRDDHGRWATTAAPDTTKAGNPHPHAGKRVEHPSLDGLNTTARLKAEDLIQTAIGKGKDAAIERGRSYLASSALGRDFGESSESYEARNPHIAQLSDWLDKWEAGKKNTRSEVRYSEDQPRDDHGRWTAGGLTVAPEAPSTDKPIAMVFGGSFNPPHLGHVQAAEDAKELMRAAGYNVEKVIVAPTADKLLAAKLGDQRYSLDDRVALSQMTFPPSVLVTGGPAKAAEAQTGKLRRTQLADWTQEKFPGYTVVNVTGEDAAPGHPPAFPSLYAGDKGSNHEGYYYLAMPRHSDSISSTRIRAALSAGQEPPGLTAAAKNYLKDVMKRSHHLAEQRYSEDQPRDDHGRFANGSGDEKSSYLKGTTGKITTHGWLLPDNNKFVPLVGSSLHTTLARQLGYDGYDAAFNAGLIKVTFDKEEAPYFEADLKMSEAVSRFNNALGRMDGVKQANAGVWVAPDDFRLLKWDNEQGWQAKFKSEQHLAAAARMLNLEQRYSEDQPRDDHGRFASGGGALPELSPESKQMLEQQKKLNDLLKQRGEIYAKMREISGKLNPLDASPALHEEHARLWEQYKALQEQIGQVSSSGFKPTPLPTLDQKLAMVQRVRDEVERQGMSSNWAGAHIIVSFDPPPTVTIAGKTMQYAGAADLDNGVITLYPGTSQFDSDKGTYPAFEDKVPGILAHEIEHERFQTVLHAYQYERDEVNRMATTDPEQFDKIRYRNGYGVRTEFESKYPVLAAFEPYLEGASAASGKDDLTSAMAKADGVTSYSRMYWDNYQKGTLQNKWSGNVNARELCYHETLAEMARASHEAGGISKIDPHAFDWKAPSREWKQLYSMVAKYSKQHGFGN